MERELSKLEMFAVIMLIGSYESDMCAAEALTKMGRDETAESYRRTHKGLCQGFLRAIDREEACYSFEDKTYIVTQEGIREN